MAQKDIAKLAQLVASRRCVLFAGAGLTADYGGATWPQLITYLQDEFNYQSPLQEENNAFEIMEDLCNQFTPVKVYEKIQQRLVEVKLKEPVVKLSALPWFSVFTTNYDTALEEALRENQKLDILTLDTGKELDLDGIQSEIHCIKLMGSCNIEYGREGQMVLTPGDYIQAREERARIFDRLERHVANRSFLFIGYSFEDDLLIDIIRKLKNLIGDPPNKFYALFRSEPTEVKAYRLKQMNIEVIVADIKDFSTQLFKRTNQLIKTDFSTRRVAIGSDVVPIDTTKVPAFLKLYSPVFYPEMFETISAYFFLKGETYSFYPFEQKWHYEREEINKVLGAVTRKNTKDAKPSIISIEGNLGTGRTFITLAVIYRLMTEQRALCFNIPSYAETPIPTPDELDEYISEVERGCENINCEKPHRIVFWAEFAPGSGVISRIMTLSLKCKYPVTLLYENLKHNSTIDEYVPLNEHYSIQVKDDVSEDEKKDLIQYILDTVKEHRFQQITKEDTIRIIDEEKEFLPIMYRLLDPSRLSIRRSIQKSYHEVTDQDAKECITLCALSTSMGVPMPVAILKGALSDYLKKFFTYDDVFELIEEQAKEFIKDYQDTRTNPLVDIYHSIIAKYILDFSSKRKIDDYMISIGKSCNLHSRIEAEFVNRIFIDKGVNSRPGQYQSFSVDGLLQAFIELKRLQPARVIIHHYARLKKKIDINDAEIIPLLKEALAEPPEIFSLDEKKENVLTTLADTLWAQKKEILLNKSRSDPEIKEIITLLMQARGRHGRNLPPFHVHAKILTEFGEVKEENAKLSILNEALEVIEQGLDISRDHLDVYKQFKDYRVNILSKIDFNQAMKTAEEMITTDGDGTGYYTLARIAKDYRGNPEETKAFLIKAIEADTCPIGAFAMMLDIALLERFPDYEGLMRIVEHLEADGTYRESWISSYNKGVISFISGDEDAKKHFKTSERMAPPFLQRKVRVHWNDKSTGKRMKFLGSIQHMSSSEGFIYPHTIPNNPEEIYFNVWAQKYKSRLRKGLNVEFELGFSPKGPQAFDVRPFGTDEED